MGAHRVRIAFEIVHDLRARTATLEEERLQNAELRKQIQDISDGGNNEQRAVARQIPRPQGTAGTNFSIQEAMGLSGSTKKYETYKAIQVRCCIKESEPMILTMA